MSGDIFGCEDTFGGGSASRIPRGEASDAARCLTVHRVAPTTQVAQLQMSIVLRFRNPATRPAA